MCRFANNSPHFKDHFDFIAFLDNQKTNVYVSVKQQFKHGKQFHTLNDIVERQFQTPSVDASP